ncbi:YegS/Rv2252/BmrU family lipid kinase [Herbivorax sp. ANBcel31]|uniref:YegS/Rv2252/BmrU family lipid kinase n=1 Tax=Herbivorax sp. ANBcel31 TaxID=3069754 RepID=UPI0027B5356A|nr:YegS/Rv2252/BmrU family lipid kinase [Herbivorax sp. ANBcel31]MDQ2085717.1 YegS/Rv2252/BmrU family lipid kinase [Herbivorax sp. ANBcel31]
MKRALLIYNPFSGVQSTPNKLDYIIDRFQKKNILIQPYRTSKDNKHFIQVLKNNQFDFVVASGGDGTISSVGDILLKENINVPMGLIPSGTCNDFASILNIPDKLDKCIDIILSGKTKKVDVGLVSNEKHFFSSFAGGAFVEVSFSTHKELKKSFGPFAYYLKAISEVTSLKSFKMRFETDDEIIEEDILLFFILNGNQAGGFNNIIKDADYTDGMMDIIIIKNCNPIEMAGIFFKVLGKDNLQNKNVIKLRTKKCVIKSYDDIALSIDGEKGCCLPVNIEFKNKAIEVFAK